MIWSYDEYGQKDNPEVMTQIGIKCGSGKVLVESWVEFIITNVGHEPDDSENEDPGASGVEALNSVVFEKWIEEKLA